MFPGMTVGAAMETRDIDFVIAWVDGSDPEWQKTKAQYRGEDEKFNVNNVRYRDWGLLQYWFRAVETYAPWVRKIHFVTCGHVPQWLKLDHPKLHIVKHSDYMDAEFLPTFSANPIELNLHRIDGLADQFVFFNDDMYLNAPVKKEDFFVNGLPRGCAVLNPPTPSRHGIPTIILNDLGILSEHFDFKRQFAKNVTKWIHPIYGTKLLRTLLLLPWRRYLGFYDMHLPSPFLKSTYEEVWEREEDTLREISTHRFRSDSDVNQYLMMYWQLAKGEFVPVSPKIGKMFYVGTDLEIILKVIKSRSMKMICINDSETVADFDAIRERLVEAFEEVLSQKSSFEK